MMNGDWRDRPNKVHARVFGFENLRVKRALMLPGAQCEDIHMALRHGIFTKETQICAVERDRQVYRSMKRSMPKLSHEANLMPLDEYAPRGDFDLVSLDFCGTLTEVNLDWLTTWRPLLRARVLITSPYANRNNQWLKERVEELQKNKNYRDFLVNIPRSQRDEHVHGVQYLLEQALGSFRTEILYYRDQAPMVLYRMDRQ